MEGESGSCEVLRNLNYVPHTAHAPDQKSVLACECLVRYRRLGRKTSNRAVTKVLGGLIFAAMKISP